MTEILNMKFIFMHDFIGTVYFNKSRFDAYSLATLLYKREEPILTQIKNGMKIIKYDGLYDMDEKTFNSLIKYGIHICNEHSKNVL